MKSYKVNANILLGGAVYHIGETVELDDATAKYLSNYLEPSQTSNDANDKQEKQDNPEVDYDELTTQELKKIVKERGVDIEPTGKHGAVKSDYVKALEQSDK